MAEDLGKIEKPAAESFRAGRKLYFVPLLFAPRDPKPDYLQLIDKYWQEVETQVSNLETKLGRVNRVYHELVPAGGDEGMKATEELNPRSFALAKSRVDNAATLETMEDPDLLTEFMDWNKCLSVGLQNEKVFKQVFDAYQEAFKKRNAGVIKHIDETLKDGETGLLLIREGLGIQFPADIQFFYISPPTLDEIKRWFRSRETPPGGQN